ncbi:hypothetical protein MRX96_023135, partial [Rhipicephalus microplus]
FDFAIEKVWDMHTPLEQIFWAAIWFVIIMLCITTTWLCDLVVMHKKASEFLSSINYSVDPCDDFEGFACTGARQPASLASRRRHISDPWLVQFDNAAKHLQDCGSIYNFTHAALLSDVLVNFDFKDEEPRSADYNFMRKFYKKCKPDVTGTSISWVVERIRVVLQEIGLARWPMLEVDDSLDLFDVLQKSFLQLGITGLFTLQVKRDLMFGHMGHAMPYSIHIGPPQLYLPKEFPLLREEDNTAVFEIYRNRVKDVTRAFRKRVELTGISREIIRLQYYLSKVSNGRALVNYLGWIIVDSLSGTAFRHQPDIYRTGAEVVSPRNTVETCARLAIKMAPATSARIVFHAEVYRRACVSLLRTFLTKRMACEKT